MAEEIHCEPNLLDSETRSNSYSMGKTLTLMNIIIASKLESETISKKKERKKKKETENKIPSEIAEKADEAGARLVGRTVACSFAHSLDCSLRKYVNKSWLSH